MNNDTKLIPYGMTDYASIIGRNYYYVDKTRYIAEIERAACFFFIVRPRRFCNIAKPRECYSSSRLGL